MWWWTDGLGFWLLMPVFMVLCAVLMSRTMRLGGLRGIGMCGFGGNGPHGSVKESVERILDERLARGEIEIEEHSRLRAAIAGSSNHLADEMGIKPQAREPSDPVGAKGPG